MHQSARHARPSASATTVWVVTTYFRIHVFRYVLQRITMRGMFVSNAVMAVRVVLIHVGIVWVVSMGCGCISWLVIRVVMLGNMRILMLVCAGNVSTHVLSVWRLQYASFAWVVSTWISLAFVLKCAQQHITLILPLLYVLLHVQSSNMLFTIKLITNVRQSANTPKYYTMEHASIIARMLDCT